jgi:hypothetical protein
MYKTEGNFPFQNENPVYFEKPHRMLSEGEKTVTPYEIDSYPIGAAYGIDFVVPMQNKSLEQVYSI